MPTVQFEVIEEFDKAAFTTTVEKMVREGWKLHGQLIAFPDTTGTQAPGAIRYIQALVKEDHSDRSAPGFRVFTDR